MSLASLSPAGDDTAIDALRELGFALHEQGDLDAAESTYREILERAPDDADVRCALGVVALQAGRYEVAAQILAAAVACRPTAAAHCYLGNALSGSSRVGDALANYDRAVALEPGYAPAHINRGHALRALGSRADALASYDRAIGVWPTFFEAIVSRAEVLRELGNLTLALAAYDQAIALRPALSAIHLGRCTVLLQLRRWQDALTGIDKAIDLGAYTAEAHYVRALAKWGLNLLEEALTCFQQALALMPDFAEAWLGSAKALLSLGQPAESLECVDRALALKQPCPDGCLTRAAALQELGRTAEAFAAVESAIADQPDNVDALNARGNMLRARGDYRGAVSSFGEALRFNPCSDAARIGMAIAQIPCVPATVDEADASREAFGAALANLAEDLRVRLCVDATSLVGFMQPFPLAYQERDNRALLEPYGRMCAGLMADWRREAGLVAPQVPARASRLRIAVVSAQICDHAVYNALTRGWLERLDRRRFEVAVFHTNTRFDAQTIAARSRADHFESGRRSLLEWVRSIQSLAPHVILYPEVGMDPAALQLAAQRIAPVQAAAWGHPETTGLPTIDYYLSADSFEPADADRYYAERLVRLPNLGCYYEPPAAQPREAADLLPADRSAAVLVCAGAPLKYAPEHDWVYVEIARRLGRCQLHFFSFHDGLLSARLIRRLATAFRGAGLEPQRYLVVHPWATSSQFREFLSGADLMLDTLGFSGFNTVVQALECRLPVVTYRGRFLRGRFGTGLLERIAVNDLITETAGDYVERAVAIAGDGQERARLVHRIRAGLPKLFRDESSIEALESFLLEAVERVS